jgi:hypothetical protein
MSGLHNTGTALKMCYIFGRPGNLGFGSFWSNPAWQPSRWGPGRPRSFRVFRSLFVRGTMLRAWIEDLISPLAQLQAELSGLLARSTRQRGHAFIVRQWDPAGTNLVDTIGSAQNLHVARAAFPELRLGHKVGPIVPTAATSQKIIPAHRELWRASRIGLGRVAPPSPPTPRHSAFNDPGLSPETGVFFQ